MAARRQERAFWGTGETWSPVQVTAKKCSPVPRNREVLFVKVIRGLSKIVRTDPTPQVCLPNARRASD